MGETWSVLEAENIARKVHAPQKRWDKSPYITHLEAVAKLVHLAYANDPEIAELECIAWLHDVIEDSKDPKIMEAQLRVQFPMHIVDAIKAMSRNKNEDYFGFVMRVVENPLAIKVKIADISHNLYDLKKGSMRDKYLLARFVLEGYRDGFLKVPPHVHL